MLRISGPKVPGKVSMREMKREARREISSVGGTTEKVVGRGERMNGKMGFVNAMQATRMSVLCLLARHQMLAGRLAYHEIWNRTSGGTSAKLLRSATICRNPARWILT